jgi:3-hexulose-6-phosphate synthase
MKIVDGAQYESELAFDAGADIVTVLAAAEDETIAISAHTAQSYGKEIMVDLIGVKRKLDRVSEIDKLGARYLCVHRATDLGPRGDGLQNELKQLRAVSGSTSIAVAGGIDLKTLKAMKDPLPDIAIVGSYITADSNRREAAQRIRQAIHTQGN